MKDIIFNELKKILPGVQKNVSLKNYTTFKIGGPAKYFFVAKEKEDLVKAAKTAKELNLAIFILGGGSNILASDKGFKGLVVKMHNLKIETKAPIFKKIGALVYAEAGVKLSNLVMLAAENGFSGMEWAAGIPGTIGGAIYGNSQAFGTKMSELIKDVEVLNLKNIKIKKWFSKEKCEFSLKNSIFKKNKNLAIISAVLEFKKKPADQVKNQIKEFLDYRKAKHPSLSSAGSVFINPEKEITNKKLLDKFPELNEFNKKEAIPVGYLIEKAGLKGKKIGQAQISEKHANFIINLGGAKAKDVLKLMTMARGKVKKTFGIDLEQEVQFVGF
ncbi:MAG: UDP-N-acetylmuramate dehydrogenase [Parcubacteria group bacterium Licking1014_1]|nr:MAG: UDP-N-acetylmuramate dehydrogenase [Parcubacteria group bacterium Licking1014_1]